MDGPGSACGEGRTVPFGTGPARRARSDDFQQIQARHPGRTATLASTESVAKALAATDASVDILVQLIGYSEQQAASVPLVTMAEAAQRGHFDEHGVPFRKRRRRIALPPADGAFALEISGDTYEPAYRDGDVLLVSRATAIQRGHGVAVKSGAKILIGKLGRTAKSLELVLPGATAKGRTLPAAEVEWIARIVWVRPRA